MVLQFPVMPALHGEALTFDAAPSRIALFRMRNRGSGTVFCGISPSGRLCRRPAGGTPPPMAPILGDVRRDRRQLGHLMASRAAEIVSPAQGMRALATPTGAVDMHATGNDC